MHTRTATFGFLLTLAAPGSTFFMPGPSRVISGRRLRESTSKVVFMGRGDVRTKKGKRMRHTYGKCRLRTKKKTLNRDGEVVVKAAPVARRWEPVEWVESEIQAESPSNAEVETQVDEEAVVGALEDESAEAMEIPETEVAIEPVMEETLEDVLTSPEAEATVEVPAVAEDESASEEVVEVPAGEESVPAPEAGSDVEPATEA